MTVQLNGAHFNRIDVPRQPESDELKQLHNAHNDQGENDNRREYAQKTGSQAEQPADQTRDQAKGSGQNTGKPSEDTAEYSNAGPAAAEYDDGEQNDQSNGYDLPHIYHQFMEV